MNMQSKQIFRLALVLISILSSNVGLAEELQNENQNEGHNDNNNVNVHNGNINQDQNANAETVNRFRQHANRE